MNWISVTDKLPDDSKPVLIWLQSGHCGIGNYYNDRWNYKDNRYLFTVTHWMPLPDKPKT